MSGKVAHKTGCPRKVSLELECTCGVSEIRAAERLARSRAREDFSMTYDVQIPKSVLEEYVRSKNVDLGQRSDESFGRFILAMSAVCEAVRKAAKL